MIPSPENFAECLKKSSLAEIIKTRNEVIEDIREYEDAISKGCEVMMMPDPFDIYIANHLYLVEIAKEITARMNYESHKEILKNLNEEENNDNRSVA